MSFGCFKDIIWFTEQLKWLKCFVEMKTALVDHFCSWKEQEIDFYFCYSCLFLSEHFTDKIQIVQFCKTSNIIIMDDLCDRKYF